ncbi:hypothetical protein [Roseobacter litoralis]|uniref:hypothetical protein n=1 Tax=Roseobacter litoralis TaxID=42443 RepID=UPI00249586B3|nr:hypothetical protein [Roseobacter litoralis]
MATFYALTVPEFVAELGLSGRDMFDLEWRLSEGEGALIAARTGLSAETAQAMTFRDMVPAARVIIARKNRHHCPLCPEEVHRISAALPWKFRCPVHGVALCDATGATLSDMLGAGRFTELEICASAGVAVLDAWARGVGQGALGPDEMLAFLTARHRRASPPNVSEQPRMSLGDRRDYHEFLTTPILRQALAIIVPEYDKVAPVLTKPVRPGLYGLGQGSLLQSFALTIGISRIAEDPVTRAIKVLLSSDADGQERLRDVLKAWPLSLRRRISARLWRAQRDEKERQISEKATRQRQSHKYRRVQSHQYRYRIS